MNITLLLRLQSIGTGNFLFQLLNAGTKKAAITVPVVMPLYHHQFQNRLTAEQTGTRKSYTCRYREYHPPAT